MPEIERAARDRRPAGRRAAERAGRGRATASGPLIVCDNLVKIYKVADLEVVALQGLDLLVEQRRVHRARRRVGFRQEHAPQHPRRARRPVRRPGRRRGLPLWRSSARASRRATCARSSGSSGSRPRGTCCRTSPPPRTSRCRWCSTASPTTCAPARSMRAAARGRDGGPRRPPARSDVGRRTAACRDRGCAGQRSRRAPRRRADRRARHRHRGRHLRAAPPAQPRDRRHDRRRHPRPARERPGPAEPWPSATGGSAARSSATVRARWRSTTSRPNTPSSTASAGCSSPRDYVEALGLADRVRLELEDDHITIRPDDRPADR